MKPEKKILEDSIDRLSRLMTEPDEFKIWLKSFLITNISYPLIDFSFAEYPHEYLSRIYRLTNNCRFQERLRFAVKEFFRDWNINAINTEPIEFFLSLLNLIAELPISEMYPDIIELALSGSYCGVILKNEKRDFQTLILQVIASLSLPGGDEFKDRLMELVKKYILDIRYTPLCFRIAWQVRYENAIEYLRPLLECSYKRKFDIYGTIERFLWGCGELKFKDLLVPMLLRLQNKNMWEDFLKILFKLGVEIRVPYYPRDPNYLLMRWDLYDQPVSWVQIFCKNLGIMTQIAQLGPQLKDKLPETLLFEIVERSNEAIGEYFEELEKAQKPLNELKVLLIGDGGAGKTSLMKRLIGMKFDPTESKTHGINIKKMTVNVGGKKIKINIWDFGGQQIMHFTHQFFLSKRSLYILVLDGRKDEKTEYWLKHIESFGGDSPVLVVLNKIDENYSNDVNRKFLKKKYKGIIDFYKVSCKSRDGIDVFLKDLKKSILQVRHLSTVWPKSWFNVKNELENMEKDFIDYDEYSAICLRENIKEQTGQDTLVDFLHDLGIVLHFKDFKLKTTHILAPEWVTTAVYKIINSKDIAESKGLLKLSLLEKILKQENDSDYYYPREKYRYIIDLMQKFELCYEIDSETILIPDLLEVQESSFDFDYIAALKFLIQYDFLPLSIMARFMVKMHKDIKGELHWRTGVVLENKSFGSTAAVKSDNEEKRIYIYVQGEQKRDYFAAILHALRVINDSFEKLEAVEKVPMPDEPNITASYNHLILLEKRGIDQFIPDGSEREYNVKQLLGTIDKDTYGQLLTQIKNEFSALSTLDPQERGVEFEKFLNRLFQLYDLAPKDSFRKTGEQIDGSFQMGGDTYLLEAKWRNDKTWQADLLVFEGKVSGKAKWTRGLFISISGFTNKGLAAFSKGRQTSIIGMDGEDLEAILERKFTLPEAIELKSRYAAETNEFFCPLPELKKRYAGNT